MIAVTAASFYLWFNLDTRDDFLLPPLIGRLWSSLLNSPAQANGPAFFWGQESIGSDWVQVFQA